MKLPLSTRRIALAAGAVLVLGGSAVGIASAQSAPATPTSQQNGYQKFIDALAQKLGVSSQTLQQDIADVRQEQGLTGNRGFGGPGHGPRGGFRAGINFEVAAQAIGFGGPGMIRQGLDVAAQAIGITPQELRTQLPGKSLAQVAQAHGKTGADVATALKNAAHQRIDEAATNNRLNGQDPNTLKTQADQRIDQLVNQVMPQGGPGRRGGPGADDTAVGA
jgi:hypothetical protein